MPDLPAAVPATSLAAGSSGPPPSTGDERIDRILAGLHASDDELAERIVASRTIHTGRYMDVRIDTIERTDHTRHEREICVHPGAVAVLAIDAQDRVLLVRQFRVAAGRVLLEIPAGTLDRHTDGSTEDPDGAARRELEEETGFRAGTWRRLASFWTAPGFATELMHLYLATDLVLVDVDRLTPDDDEALELVRLPAADTIAAAAAGAFEDAKSLLALLWLARFRETART